MLGLTLRLARGTAGRLVLAGIAIALGTGFVAAVLLTSALFTRTVTAAVSAEYAGADVVVTSQGPGLSADDVARVASVPGVAAAEGQVDSGVELIGSARTQYVDLQSALTTPALPHPVLRSGTAPSARGEVALSATAADRLDVGLGDQVRVRTYQPVPAASTDGGTDTSTDTSTSTDTGTSWEPVDVPVTVVGLLEEGFDTPLGGSGAVLAVPADALAWGGASTTSDTSTSDTSTGSDTVPGYTSVLAVAAPGTAPEQLRDAVAAALPQRTDGWSPSVQTAEERTAQSVDDFTGGTAVLTGAVLAFAVVALVVAASVITNTFSVLVAQRTRQLALLRCVGMTSAQVRRGVLVEAALLGLAASAVGVALGTALAAVAAAVLAGAARGLELPSTVALTPVAVLAPLAVGVLATVVAAWAPARAATRVSPLAALRPASAPDLRTSGSRLRLAASLLLLIGGSVLLAGGTAVATGLGADTTNGATGTSDELLQLGLPVAVLGGVASFTGVLVGAVFIVPRVVALAGRVVGVRGGAPARLATLNAVRNPRRTAATTSALLIGTTLVALMLVGAATTSRTLSAALDQEFPVDASVTAVPDGGGDEVLGSGSGRLTPAVVSAAEGVRGVAASAELLTGEVTSHGGAGMSPRGETYGLDLVAAEPAQLAGVLTDPSAVAALAPGTVVLPTHQAERLGVSDGDQLTLTSMVGTGVAASSSVDLRVAVSQLGGQQLVVVPSDFTRLVPGATTSAVWLRLAPGTDALDASDALQDAVSEASGTGADGSPAVVEGLAAQRATFQQVIDTMLLVVVGLLAVAVVIALVGVANTLSLSVIERTRENAVLRALGLTRGQLRRMLALEGALVAGVGGLLGVVLGALYGWAGAASLLGGLAAAGGDAIWTPALPWGRLALLLLVAVAAGLLASVLPARRAVRTPPVAALADQ